MQYDRFLNSLRIHKKHAVLRYAFRIALLALTLMALSRIAGAQEAWSDSDIGAVGTAGSGSFNSSTDTFTISGAGLGVGGTGDACNFYSVNAAGNLEIIARVDSLQNVANSATAGLMMRGSTAAGSISAYVNVTAGNGVGFVTRSATGATSVTAQGGTGITAPVWLRLVSSSTTVNGTYALSGYSSSDGTSWTLIGSQTIQMPNSILVGLTVSSSTTAQTATATFDRVNVMTNVPQQGANLAAWYRADAGVVQSSGTVTSWQDQSGNSNTLGQTTTSLQPSFVGNAVDGLPVVHFTHANNSFLSVASNSTLNPSQTTIFVVSRNTGSSAGRIVDKFSSSTGYSMRFNSSTNPALFVNGVTASGTLSPVNTWGLLEAEYDSSFNTSLYVNGTLSSTTGGAAIYSNTQAFSVGGLSTTGNTPDCDIAEIIVFNAALSTVARQSVEAYLYQKYSVGYEPPAPAPTYSSPGGIYTTTQTITLSAPIAGETIYYTTDGSTPTTSSSIYSTPIVVSANETIKTLEVYYGYTSSSSSAIYTIDSTANFTRGGLVAWYRADAGITSTSGTVTQWLDQSGNGNNAAGSGSTAPTVVSSAINGKPAIQFSTSNSSILSAPNSSLFTLSQLTIIAVTEQDSGAASGSIEMVADKRGGSSAYSLQTYNSGSAPSCYARLSMNNGDASDFGSAIGAGTFQIMEGTYDQQNIKVYVNGGTPSSNAYTAAISNNTAPFTIGGSSGQPSLGGKIAEIMLFNSVLNDAQRHQVEEYLYQRYGLGSPLQAPSPILTPGPGIYNSSQTVTITPGQPGDTVYYTTDGTAPTTSSPQYTSGIFVGNSMTIKAMEVASGYINSQVVGGGYTIDTSTNFTRSGLVAWYRADTGVLSTTGTVTQWNDQSGNGNNAVGSAGSEPSLASGAINGQPAIQFYNSNPSSILTVPNSTSLSLNQMTIVAVADQDNLNSSTYATVLDKGQTPDAYALRFYNSGGTPACQARFSVNNNAGTVSGTITSLGSFSIIEGTYDLQNLKAYINGAAPSSVAYTSTISNVTSPLTLGGTNNSPTYSLSGKIAEVMVFNSVLTDIQRHQVEIYLHQRYGVGIPPQAPSPTLAPGPGIYSSSQLVTMTPGQAGDTIYYTTDGTTPTTSSNVYSNGVAVSGTTTLNVMETTAGYANSQTVGGTYTIDTNTNFARSGLVAWYRADAGVTSISGTLTWYDQSGNGHNATGSGTTAPTLVSGAINGQPALQFSTTNSSSLTVSNSTAFNLSQVSIIAVAERDSGSSNSYETVLDKRSGSDNTAYALHIYNGGSSPYSPRMSVNGAAWSLEPTLSANAFGVIEGLYDQLNVKLYVNGAAAAPSAYTGAISNNSAPLTIGGASANSSLGGKLAEIMVFNTALSDAQRQQVEAYLHQRYFVGATPQVASAPTFSPGAGIYASPQTVTLTSATPAATIYYTTDGSTPTTTSASMASGGTIVVSSGKTINAISVASGFVNSSVASASYAIESTVQAPEPAFTQYRYSRGGAAPTLDQSFDSFVIALNQTLGTTLPATGNSGFTSGSLPWFLSIANPIGYHVSRTVTEQTYTGSVTFTDVATYPTSEQFQNPIVAFGAVGGELRSIRIRRIRSALEAEARRRQTSPICGFAFLPNQHLHLARLTLPL